MAETAPLPSPAAVMGQARRENFPVASLLLPRRARAHLLAVYGFARLVDDVGDEVTGDRLALLDQIEADLDRLWDGGRPREALIARLAPAVAEHSLPSQPFKKLIEANRRDQVVHRYATFEELESYCQLSANPVGELVLLIFGAATPERMVLSDKVCTALQLAEHWQDVAEDYAAGRIYLPAEDLARFGLSESDLAAASAPPGLRALMAFEVRRARELIDAGAPLAATLRGRAAFAVQAFVAGGRSALHAIERADYDVLGSTPRAGRAERARQLTLALLRGRRR
ncbi:MAG TPA: squalene synthase HpnC [Solirubrobacteraceae bacterium]|nr:squalene synthase HpnC [Solirubrobacteraceae bacterium]